MRFGAGVMGMGACLLASCGKPPETGNDVDRAAVTVADGEGNTANVVNAVVNSAETKVPGSADEDGIRAAIDRLYADYATRTGPTTSPRVSPDLKAALDRAEKADEAGLGYDPWCECQDFEPTRFKYAVKGVEFAPDGDHARATVTLDLGFGDSGPVHKWIAFLRTPKGWLIDDVGTAANKSLKAQIRAMPAASAAPNAAG